MEKEIGARLRNARESKGMSLEQVQETTKIKTRYLHAIEENDFNVLPGKFYTRAFIREYASAVGIDPEQMMEEHKDEMPSFEKEGATQYKRVQHSPKEPAAKRGNINKYLPTVMTFVLIIGILFVAYTFIKNSNNDLGSGAADQEVSNNDINVPEASEAEDSESAPVSSESSGEDSTDDEKDTNKEQAGEEGSSSSEKENPSGNDQESESFEISLAEKGTGNFPQHTYNISTAEEKSLTIELEGTAYLEIQGEETGENLISPIEYSPADSPVKVDVSDKKQVFIKTGNALGTTVKINGEQIDFQTQQATQKLLLNFK